MMMSSEETKVDNLSSTNNNNSTTKKKKKKKNEGIHIVIVGSGMAGLSAAKELLKNKNSAHTNNIHVTIVESNNYVGGRVHGDETFIPGYVIDTGAEVMHGGNTVLTNLVDSFINHHANNNDNNDNTEEKKYPLCSQEWTNIPKSELINEFFLLSHADGGPDIKPTKEGKYGMYYMDGELMMYDDERVRPIEVVLGTLDSFLHHDNDNDMKYQQSVGEVINKHISSQHLKDLCAASYGNTAGSNDLNQINLSMICEFEEYWSENELEGDAKLSPKVGMAGVAKELYHELSCLYHDHFSMDLNWKVTSIQIKNEINEDDSIVISSSDGELIHAKYVIVTTPPPIWQSFMTIPPSKQEAVNKLGMNPAMKCALKFNKRFWPEQLQSLVMANCPIPEMWLYNVDEYYVVICFLTSQAAISLQEMTNNGNEEDITNVFVDQMSKVLSIPEEDVREGHLETRVYTWKHAYMFPKVGFTREHLNELSKPMGDVCFAGEATNTNACCTVQAAMETGIREANRIMERIKTN